MRVDIYRPKQITTSVRPPNDGVSGGVNETENRKLVDTNEDDKGQ
jgi:hypothetical protein